MKKQEILFVIDSLRIGGVQSALFSMLGILDYNKYNVTLQLFSYEESYVCALPSEVDVRRMPFIIDSVTSSAAEVRRRGIISYIIKGLFSLLCRIIGSDKVFSFLFKHSKKDPKHYDVAISYNNNLNLRSTYFGCNMYVLDNVNATRKISWLHVDYHAMCMDTPYNNAEYMRFDRVVHVSCACKEKFIESIPELTDKSVVVYNVVNPMKILEKSKEYSPDYCGEQINIVTVSRIDANKNIIACLRVARCLLDKGVAFKWYIVGGGVDERYISNKVQEYKLEKNVLLLGYKLNPYPYIANADILVSTSLSESFGLSIYEATLLGVPVVAYSYPALKEIVADGKNGFICHTESEVFETLYRLSSDRTTLLQLKKEVKPLLSFYDVVASNNDVIGMWS